MDYSIWASELAAIIGIGYEPGPQALRGGRSDLIADGVAVGLI